MNFNLQFEYSPLLILPALIISLLLSYLLYRNEDRIPKLTGRILFVFRTLLITILLLLLLNPIIKHFENKVEKANFVIAIDNSQSIKEVLSPDRLDSIKNDIASFTEYLSQNNINPVIYDFNGKVSLDSLGQIDFSEPTTNISNLISDVSKNYENRNLGGMLLLSDGLYNRGISPEFISQDLPIHTLGLGDTSEKRDIWIQDLRYNEIAFFDNYFQLEVDLQKNSSSNVNFELQVLKGSKLIDTKNIGMGAKDFETIKFKLLADEEGQQQYTIRINTNENDDSNKNNNTRNAYIEVIEGKEKILILALNPHPDIKAIKASLEATKNYEIITHYASDGILESFNYDLAILHQVPNMQNLANAYVKTLISKNVPIWFILGPSSNLFELDRHFSGVKMKSKVRQSDDVLALVNPDFKKFDLSEESEFLLSKLPPIDVPFAKYELGPGAEVILFQAVNRINTGKPLLLYQQLDNQKFAFMAGDGLWAWRMFEYSLNENFEFTNSIITKTVQLLSLKDDKRKFRIRIKNENELLLGLPVVIETEMYNDIYESVFGIEVDLELKGPDNKITEYNYVHSENKDFSISGLQAGVYSYSAKTIIDGEEYSQNGQFTIRELQLESLNTRANFKILRDLSEKSNSRFLTSLKTSEYEDLIQNSKQGIIHSREVNSDVISIKWIFFVILALISIEWFTRKFSGAY